MTHRLITIASSLRTYTQSVVLCTSLFATTAISSSSIAVPPASELVESFELLGLNPESLAALDVVGSEPSVALDRFVEEYETYEQLLSLQSSIMDHQQTVYTAKAILRDHSEDTEAQQSLDQAQTQIVLLTNLANDTKTNLINTLLEGLANSILIDPVVHSQGLFAKLPPAYRMAVDTAGEAKELSWALSMKEVADSNGTELPSGANQTIQQAHGQYEVQAALSRISVNEQPIRLTMTQWALTH